MYKYDVTFGCVTSESGSPKVEIEHLLNTHFNVKESKVNVLHPRILMHSFLHSLTLSSDAFLTCM